MADDAPLDMRLSLRSPVTAADILQTCTVDELETLLTDYGQEPHAAAIARAIVHHRSIKPLCTVRQLRHVVLTTYKQVLGQIQQKEEHHMAMRSVARVFQAFRIAVNDELRELELGLQAARLLLKPAATLSVVTFHSLEHAIVASSLVKYTTIYPTTHDIQVNSRAKSARLTYSIM
jgi:16S rRNA (cytosine1402-N4)-methyltransferase